MNPVIKHPRIERSPSPTMTYSHYTQKDVNKVNFTLYQILDHNKISFNMGQSCAIMTANDIGYELDTRYYSDPDFARGYAQSLGYIHGINGKEKNISTPRHTDPSDMTTYDSVQTFKQSVAKRSRIMNAVNSKHKFVVTNMYKLEYTRGWIYGQYEVRWQHDMYSLEQQGFIYANSDPDIIPKLDVNNQLHIRPKFILGFCAGIGYRDYKNSNARNILTFSSKFGEIMNITKEKCQIYYDLLYCEPPI